MRILPLLFLLLFGACNPGTTDQVKGNRPDSTAAAKPVLEIQTYGEAGFPDEGARSRVARKWGFSYRAVAGCVVTEELLRTADSNNAQVARALAARHGADWKARFEKEVEEAYRLEQRIRATALAHPQVAAAQKALNSEGKGLLFEPGAAHPDGSHEVIAYTYDNWQGQPAYVTRFNLSVDLADSSVKILSTDRTLLRPIQ